MYMYLMRFPMVYRASQVSNYQIMCFDCLMPKLAVFSFPWFHGFHVILPYVCEETSHTVDGNPS